MRVTFPHKEFESKHKINTADRRRGHTEWRQFPKQVFEITASTQSLIFIQSALKLHLPFIWVFSADRVSFLSVLSDPWRLRGTSQFDWLVLFTVMHCLVSDSVEIPNPLPESLGGSPDPSHKTSIWKDLHGGFNHNLTWGFNVSGTRVMIFTSAVASRPL